MRYRPGEGDVLDAGPVGMVLQGIEMTAAAYEQEVNGSRGPTGCHFEPVDESLDALVRDHRGDVSDDHGSLGDSEPRGERRAAALDWEQIGRESGREREWW